MKNTMQPLKCGLEKYRVMVEHKVQNLQLKKWAPFGFTYGVKETTQKINIFSSDMKNTRQPLKLGLETYMVMWKKKCKTCR